MKLGSWQTALVLVAGVAVGVTLPRQSRDAEAQPPARDDVLAVLGGEELTREDVERTQAQDFLALTRQRHALTEQSLVQAIRIKLVEMEADSRGMTPPDLVDAEVFSQVSEPSDEEVEATYLALRPPLTKEQAFPQIRASLKQDKRNERYEIFLAELQDQYQVETLLEPLRTDVASEGFAAKGPADAPVTIVEFSDFQCPYCYQMLDALAQVTEAYSDQVRFVYRQYPIASLHPDAPKAAEASLCAEEQDEFWSMHDAMFADQGALGAPSLKATARSLGLDGERFDECLDSGKYAQEIQADIHAGREAGVSGTPALFINGRFLGGIQEAQTIADVVVDELRRAGLPAEKKRLEPRRIVVDAEGFPGKGPVDAPVTIVEFADFQCPYCLQLIAALDQVEETYADKVRLVYRQFPIASIHPNAEKAAEASLCADEQGQFWEMHDAMFQDQLGLYVDGLKEMARSIGLAGSDFDNCLDSGRYADDVARDLAAGRSAGVTGTPALFINGRLLEGIQRFETIARIVDDELSRLEP